MTKDNKHHQHEQKEQAHPAHGEPAHHDSTHPHPPKTEEVTPHCRCSSQPCSQEAHPHLHLHPSGEESAQQILKLEEELQKANQSAQDYLLQMQRLQAEFDNFRKREDKLKLQLKETVIQNVMKDFLPVVDNFERALSSLGSNGVTLDSFAEGMKMVFQQMEGYLTRMEILRIEALGKPFNPHIHEAVAKNPSEEHPEDSVMQVLQNGWSMKDTVLRPAMVIVSGGKPSA